jgi:DNA primase
MEEKSFEDLRNEIIRNLDIVEVISEYIHLHRKGNSYFARCPFHSEKTPSFSVSPSRGIWKCFGCGKGGDVIKFVAEYEGISYFEAMKKLAKKAGVSLPEKISEEDRKSFILREVANFYKEQLLKSKEAKDYLLKERKIPAQAVKEFDIGFAPKDDSLVKWAEKNGYLEDLIKLGHIKKGYGYYDTLRGRVVIPITDRSGRVLGFAGRLIEKNEKAPKYLYTSYLPKSKVLFGLDKAIDTLRDKKTLVITEGVFDVIRMHSKGIRNVVASLGAGLSLEQANILKGLQNKELLDKVVLAYDRDEAGAKAVMRDIQILFQKGIPGVYHLSIPKGFKDLDEWGKVAGLKELKEAIENSEFLISKLARKVKTYFAPEQRAKAIKKLKELIFQYPDKDFARELLNQVRQIWKNENKEEKKLRLNYNDTYGRMIKSILYAKEKGWLSSEEFELYKKYFPEVENTELTEEDKKIPPAIWKGFFSATQKLYEQALFLSKYENGELESLPVQVSQNEMVKKLKTRFRKR